MLSVPTRVIQVQAPSLHRGQRPIKESRARFKVIAGGRRFGKTRLGSALCIDVGCRGGTAWWVAPSYKMAEVGWRAIRRLALQIPLVEIKRADRLILLPGGGMVQVRSADDPDSLRGEGLDFVVMDECAFMLKAAWSEALRPALSDKKGGAMFISTPKGRNWFWELYNNGLDPSKTAWQSWKIPSYMNPFLDPEEIEAARLDLTPNIFDQEYLAEFIDDAGLVFRGVTKAARWQPEPYRIPGDQYVFGVDWGRYQDFTVIVVINATKRRVAYYDRFNRVGWALQRGRLALQYEYWKPTVIIAEDNSVGEVNIEALQQEGLPVRAFNTSPASKGPLIDGLSLAIEREELGLLNDEQMINELVAYTMVRGSSGHWAYNAPSGFHDDIVMATALAWHGVRASTGGWISFT